MNHQSLPPDADGALPDADLATDAAADAAPIGADDSPASASAVAEAPRIVLADRTRELPPRSRQGIKIAGQLIDKRQLNQAERVLSQIRGEAGEHPEFLRMLAVLMHLRGKRTEAADLLRRALEKSPNDSLIFTNLGSVLSEQGDLLGATVALQRACELNPNLAAPWHNLGNALVRQMRIEEGLDAFEHALRIDPDHVTAACARARALVAVGRIAEGAAEYRRVLSHRPESMFAWTGLAEIKTVPLTDPELEQLENLHASPTLSDASRMRLGFALGKALEEKGRYEEAFAVLSASNAASRRMRTWDSAEFTQAMDTVMKVFSGPVRQASDATLGEEVIFVVSIPRSGSTLTEHILASHSEVTGADELAVVNDLMFEESERRNLGYPDWVPLMTQGDWARLGREYLKRTERWRKNGGRSTDKGLSNWALIGVIHAMLPGARFVNCRRDPVETCWSCFKHDFSRQHSYSYDINELAAYWRDYDRMMRFWNARYPHRVHEIVYESLVDDPETQIRRLLDFCALPFEEACMRFNETQRAVRTISAGQVRQPLRHDTARAPLYGELMAPLRWALGVEQIGAPSSP